MAVVPYSGFPHLKVWYVCANKFVFSQVALRVPSDSSISRSLKRHPPTFLKKNPASGIVSLHVTQR